MNTQESNKLIAEFENRFFYGHPITSFGGDTGNALPEMKYHSSWDWLMPIGKKICDYLQKLDRPSLNHCCKGDMIEVDILCHLRTYNLEKVYEHIVLFIQWYNSQQSNTTP